ncbi:MAG: hypothetical protein V4497_06285, partial [Bacteroidota bacterium]
MENNTISTKLKRWQTYCHTFICCCKTVLVKMFWENVVIKKMLYYNMLLFMSLFFTVNSFGQLVGSSAVKANFGIDADVYSDLLQFPNIASPAIPLPSAVATDDWFQTSYPGPGFGVIDQSIPFPNVTDNHAFSRRQSVTTPTAPFPFPVVVSGSSPQPYLWLDAVYGRDNYVVGGNAEKSYFAGSGDKNSDNPSTWSIGTSGSVPQKDDLLDVYAHLRGEGPRVPDADPRPFTTLYAYAGASLAVTNGNKHADFEFFRTALETPADLSVPGKTGPDGGRTAFTFNPDGTIAIPGTIIISIDYTNGGNIPQVRIRVWMDEAVFNSFNNSNPLRPFTTVPGTFEKGDSSGTFGYGVITANNNNDTYIWGRVNINASTQGPPWGTFEGSGPAPVADYQPLQFVEIGINLTAFGLDKRGTQDACSNILGSLLVKTRSSGGGPNEGAFGSELKDFAGPFLFGNTGAPPIVSVPDKTACAGATVDLTVGATTTAGAIHYYTASNFTGEILTPTAYLPGATHIYTRSESLTNPGCYGFDEFDITVNPNPVALVLTGSSICASAPGTGTVSSSTSQSGVSYQLRIGTTPLQAAKAGTGSALSWTGLNAGTNYN